MSSHASDALTQTQPGTQDKNGAGKSGPLIYRLARGAEGYSFGLIPEFVGLAEGLRAATAVAGALGVAMMLHSMVLLWSAFGAFWTCLCDPGGRDAARFRVMGSFVALGTVSAFAGAASAGIGPGFATLMLAPLIFLPALGGVFGPGGTQSGALICVVGGVSVGFPGSPGAALALAGAFLAGGCWALVLDFALWPIRPQGPARRALASVFARLGAMVLALDSRIGSGRGLGSAEPEYRRAQRAAIERARALILGLGNGHRRLLAELEIADRIFAVLIALDHALSHPLSAEDRQAARHLLVTIADALREAEHQVGRRNPAPAGLGQAARALCLTAAGVTGPAGALGTRIGVVLGQLADGPLPGVLLPPEAPQARETSALWPLPDHIWRHAVRLTLAVMVTYAICVQFGLGYLYWATMATIVVLQPMLSTTWPRMLERVIGSIAGGLFAAAVMWTAPGQAALIAVIVPVAAATIAFKRVNYALFTACVGALFVLVIELMMPADGIAFARALDNTLGSVVALLAGLLLWPGKGERRFPEVLAEAVRANLAYAAAAVGHGQLDPETDALRRHAGVASTAAETARQRGLLEGRRRSERLDTAAELLAELRVLAGAATVRALSGLPPDPERARNLEAEAAGQPAPGAETATAGETDDLAEALAAVRMALARQTSAQG